MKRKDNETIAEFLKRKILYDKGDLRLRKKIPGYHILWNSDVRGTYCRVKHGELLLSHVYKK